MIRQCRPPCDDNNCPCRTVFFSAWAKDELQRHWNDPEALYGSLQHLLACNAAHFGWAILDRLVELEGVSERLQDVTAKVVQQVKAETIAEPTASRLGAAPSSCAAPMRITVSGR
jgi:hypothetical protein